VLKGRRVAAEVAERRVEVLVSWASHRSPNQSTQPSVESGMVSGVSPEFVTAAR